MFITLSEWVCETGNWACDRDNYFTQPIACNINEIANVQEANHSYVDARAVTMKNGRRYLVKETYDEILSMIVKASV